jgi:3-oxoacyl-[acyl-carrier protein] reductase
MSTLNGKVALVTGASKGIGAAIAKSLAAEGAAIVVNYASDQKGAEAVVAGIKKDGGQAVAVRGDVSKSSDAESTVNAAVKAFGRLDILVNNAGVYQFTPLEAIEESHYRRIFDTNVLGLLLTTKAAAKHMGEGGSVINIGSVVSEIAPAASAVYSGTKGAVESITRALSKELGPRKIRVNTLNPGLIETEGTHSAGFIGSDFAKLAVQNTPLGRIGQPNDIAAIAVFLASEQSGWMTGEKLVATGGYR